MCESAYINGDPNAVLQSELQEVGDDLTLQAVKSVKSLRAHSINKRLVSPTEQLTTKIQQSAIDGGENDQGEGSPRT